jgi:hypothetical protein
MFAAYISATVIGGCTQINIKRNENISCMTSKVRWNKRFASVKEVLNSPPRSESTGAYAKRRMRLAARTYHLPSGLRGLAPGIKALVG